MKKSIILSALMVGMLVMSGCVSTTNQNGRVTKGLEFRIGGYGEQMTYPAPVSDPAPVQAPAPQYQGAYTPVAPVPIVPAPQCAVPVKSENCNGSYSVIHVYPTDEGNYKGPRGEIYTEMPDEAKISQMYGF